jgi:tetratricopeptide (TPR) repeat protein
VANELGDLPLALHLAGRYQEHYRDVALGQPTPYLAALHPAIRQDRSGRPSAGADRRVAGAFRLNSEALDPIHPVDALARRALEQAACLAPDLPIPRALLPLARDIDPLNDTARFFDEALRRLARLGLVEEGPQGALRLPEMVVRLVLAETDAPAVSEQVAVSLLAEAERLNAAGDAAGLQTWQAHLSWVARTAERRRSPQAGRLYNELGYHARLRGAWAQARQYHERALRLGEATLGRDHPELVTWHNNLGRVLKIVGDLPGACAQLQRALSIGQQAFGSDSAEVATLHNNLGLLLHDLGDLNGALPHFESALSIGERTLGPNHPAMSVRHSNLGRLLFDLDKLADARSHYERALAISEQAFGPDHPDVATLHNHVNVVLAALGTQAPKPAVPAAPQETAEPAVETSEAAHWHDARGLTLYVQGELTQAHHHFQRAVAITEQTFGRSYPALAYRHSNLGRVLHDLGDIGEAQLHYERALRIGEAAFGPDHPDMANWHNNLGRVLHEQGDTTVARLHFERALAVAQQNLGPNHPDVMTLERNLDLVLHGNGQAKASPRIIDRLTRFIRRARP